MSHRPTGPACGNNPNYRMSDGDRQAVDDFRAYLADRAALRDRITRALAVADGWQFDGSDLRDLPDRELMRYRGGAEAVLAVLPPPVSRADVLRDAGDHLARQADELWAPGTTAHTVMHADATELRRLADEAQSGTPTPSDPTWPRRAWDLGLLHKGGDPHHCPACLKQPEPPKDFICPGAEANAVVLANPVPADEAQQDGAQP